MAPSQAGKISSVVIVGGGIGGLSFASLARRIQGVQRVVVVERSPGVVQVVATHANKVDAKANAHARASAGLGSGIGLWPNAYSALSLLLSPSSFSALHHNNEVVHVMPRPGYYDSAGRPLARGSDDFTKKFPVRCLHRDALQRMLFESCVAPCTTEISGESIPPVEFVTNVSFDRFEESLRITDNGKKVVTHLSNGTMLTSDLLIGADGINSGVRKQLLTRLGLNGSNVGKPTSCGYAYYRATVNYHNDEQMNGKPGASHQIAFESWGSGARFGYVPLPVPEVFWFCSIPTTHINDRRAGVVNCNEEDKAMLMQSMDGWKLPHSLQPHDNIKDLIQSTPATSIIRTDINKVAHVEAFPWQLEKSLGGRVALLGDSAHATAPNLAQGAGLCIEDAVDLASRICEYNLGRSIDVGTSHGGAVTLTQSWQGLVREYEIARKPRAVTIQTLADLVAIVGQPSRFPSAVAAFRDTCMRLASFLAPRCTQNVFEWTVSYSLGGNAQSLHWQLPRSVLHMTNDSDVAHHQRAQRSVLGRVLGLDQFQRLPKLTKLFRSAAKTVGGSGLVSVERARGSWLAWWCGVLAGLPVEMENAPFKAVVETTDQGISQRWVRVFDFGGPRERTFATTHNVRIRNAEAYLTESVGLGLLDSLLSFEYTVRVLGPKPGDQQGRVRIAYQSTGVIINCLALLAILPAPLLVPLFALPIPRSLSGRLPLPSWMLPRSQWEEVSTDSGWSFDGEISMPFAGRIMRYYGAFDVDQKGLHGSKTASSSVEQPTENRIIIMPKGARVIIAGGSGLLGTAVCKEMLDKGWEVIVLTRSKAVFKPTNDRSGAQIAHMQVHWDGKTGNGWSHLIHENTVIINLAGANPGANRWTDAVKDNILSSRLDSIRAIADAMQQVAPSAYPKAYLQASAAGIYGNQGSQTVDDLNSQVSSVDRSFRVSCCAAIEAAAMQVIHDKPSIRCALLRIGHILSPEGGLLPHMNRASRCGAGRLGSGQQYVPWVHIDDASRMVHTIAQSLFLQPTESKLNGAVNLSSPLPCTNKEFMEKLSIVKSRWYTFIPLPSPVLEAAIGESASVILDSQRMMPAKLIQHGYKFMHPEIEMALSQLYSKQNGCV